MVGGRDKAAIRRNKRYTKKEEFSTSGNGRGKNKSLWRDTGADQSSMGAGAGEGGGESFIYEERKTNQIRSAIGIHS